jgi:hypothetical protein
MKQYEIKYVPQEQRLSPMTVAIHKSNDGKYISDPQAQLTPPLPKEVPGKGFPALFVEVEGFTFHFASRAELNRCIEILAQKHLPSLHEEMQSQKNQHWLNRLPAEVKAWNHREKIVKYLEEVRQNIIKKSEF